MTSEIQNFITAIIDQIPETTSLKIGGTHDREDEAVHTNCTGR